MNARSVTWADIDAAHRKTYESINCSHCGQLMIRRIPESTCHRNPAEARAGRNAITHCHGCGRPIRTANRAN